MIPLLNRVGHTYIDFSYLLVIHLTIQSAYGFMCLAKAGKPRQWAADFACVVAIFAGIFALYSFGDMHQPMPWNYFLCAAAGAIGAPMLVCFFEKPTAANPRARVGGHHYFGVHPQFPVWTLSRWQ